LKKIQKILNEILNINEESLRSFYSNENWVNKVISNSIAYQERASDTFDEQMLLDFKYSLDQEDAERLISELSIPSPNEGDNLLSIKELDGKGYEDIFDYVEEDQIIATEVYKEYVKYSMREKMYEVYGDILREIEDGKLRVFRSLDVDEKKETYLEKLAREGKHLGVYWTTDRDKAESYWGTGETTYVLETYINENYVNWYETFLARMDLSLGDSEMEIRIMKGTPIKVMSIETGDGEEVDISPIEGKIFYA
jgi:hypothetical protein